MTDKRQATINTLAEQNVQTALKQGSRISYNYHTWIEARDRKKGRVLMGGLGGLGVGKMWFDERPHHARYPGYEDAPEIDGPSMGEPW